MPAIFQILRSATAGGAPGAANHFEGELAVNFPAAGGTPQLWVFGGDTGAVAPWNKGWQRVNPAPSINVVSKNIPGTTDPWTDGNAQAAGPGWPWVVSAGEVPIVSHGGQAYAFTGGPGNYGQTSGGATNLSAGMFTSLGAAPRPPQVVDLSGQNASADIGAAWTANGATVGSTSVFAAWNGKVYVLTNTGAPGTAGNWQAISQTVDSAVIDWTTGPAAQSGTVTNLPQAYAAWNGSAGNPTFTAAVNIVRWGTDARYYMVTDPGAPGVPGSYAPISDPVPPALTYRGNIDVQAAYAATVTNGWVAGDFGIAANTAGDAVGTAVTPGAGWPFIGVVGSVEVGDLLMWDGTNLHVLPMDTSLAAYLPLAGGTMGDGAAITFDTTAAQASAAGTGGGNTAAQGAASQVIIDGDGGTVDNVVLDGGVY